MLNNALQGEIRLQRLTPRAIRVIEAGLWALAMVHPEEIAEFLEEAEAPTEDEVTDIEVVLGRAHEIIALYATGTDREWPLEG